MRKKSLIFVILIFFSTTLISQNYGRSSYYKNNPYKGLPSIGISAGVMHFQGNYGSASQGNPQIGLNLFMDYKLSGSFGVSVNGLFGLLSEEFKSTYSNLNFYTFIYGGDINVFLYFNDIFNFRSRSRFSPFISIGGGIIFFNPHDFANQELDPLNQYDHYAFTTPVAAGLKFRISNKIELMLSSKFCWTTTDFVDDDISYHLVNGELERNPNNKANDTYLYTSIGVLYNIGKSRYVRARRRVKSLPSYRF